MKKTMTIFGAILFASFILTSCGGGSTKEPATTTTEQPAAAVPAEAPAAVPAEADPMVETIEPTESNSDCDQFIKDYEEFVNNYIVIAKKMKADPSDMSILTEYSKMASEAATMQTNGANCTDAKYASKLAQLGIKMASAASGM